MYHINVSHVIKELSNRYVELGNYPDSPASAAEANISIADR